MLEQPPIKLLVRGRSHQGWKEFSYTFGLDRLSGSFDVGLTTSWVEDNHIFSLGTAAGDPCRLQIGDETVLTGYIDSIGTTVSGGDHKIGISGRDVTGDLADCSAPVREYSGLTLSQIAGQLCKAFKIPVIDGGQAGAAFKRFVVNPGDAVADCIDRLVRQRGVFAYTDGTGKLILGKIKPRKPVARLILGQNIEELSVSESMTDRFSEITALSQHEGQGDSWGAEQAVQPSATAQDGGVKRHRPLILVAETQGSGMTLSERAKFEIGLRKARGLKIDVTVSGWLNDEGAVWRAGQTVEVVADSMNASGIWIINSGSLTIGEQGASASLSLISPSALERLTEREEKHSKSGVSEW
jgi:prophage tail gpP-like protein